jgi:hypothetical protein
LTGKEGAAMQKQRYIQIGVTAARDPATGEFLPAAPIFAEVTPEIEKAETAAFRDVGKIFAEKMKQYIDSGGIVERKGGA